MVSLGGGQAKKKPVFLQFRLKALMPRALPNSAANFDENTAHFQLSSVANRSLTGTEEEKERTSWKPR
jgi:hypothetical protein